MIISGGLLYIPVSLVKYEKNIRALINHNNEQPDEELRITHFMQTSEFDQFITTGGMVVKPEKKAVKAYTALVKMLWTKQLAAIGKTKKNEWMALYPLEDIMIALKMDTNQTYSGDYLQLDVIDEMVV